MHRSASGVQYIKSWIAKPLGVERFEFDFYCCTELILALAALLQGAFRVEVAWTLRLDHALQSVQVIG